MQTSLFDLPAAPSSATPTAPAKVLRQPQLLRLHLHRPEQFTKELAILRTPDGGRKIVCSSNVLPMFGLAPDVRLERQPLGALQGFSLVANPGGAVKVYERAYKRRTNAPAEAQIDIQTQTFLRETIPGHATRVHLTITDGRIDIVPIAERAPAIIQRHREATQPLTAAVVFSAGIDAYLLQQAGFVISDLVEWRPQERRDTSDKTETGVLTAMQNCRIKRVWNENVARLDRDRFARAIAHERIGLLHLAVPCTDFSRAKGKKFRDAHFDAGRSSVDLTYDALALIEIAQAPVVMVENVDGYITSDVGRMLVTRLRRWGYHVSYAVLTAPDFGGLTGRKRLMLVASLYGECPLPAPTVARRTTPIWPLIADEVPFCRDVTETTSVQLGLNGKRRSAESDEADACIGLIDRETVVAPTLMRAQGHQPSDGTYIRDEAGRIRFPNEAVLRTLQGIPADFSFDAVTQETMMEQIGQAVDTRLHDAVIAAVKDHLLAHWAAKGLA